MLHIEKEEIQRELDRIHNNKQKDNVMKVTAYCGYTLYDDGQAKSDDEDAVELQYQSNYRPSGNRKKIIHEMAKVFLSFAF